MSLLLLLSITVSRPNASQSSQSSESKDKSQTWKRQEDLKLMKNETRGRMTKCSLSAKPWFLPLPPMMKWGWSWTTHHHHRHRLSQSHPRRRRRGSSSNFLKNRLEVDPREAGVEAELSGETSTFTPSEAESRRSSQETTVKWNRSTLSNTEAHFHWTTQQKQAHARLESASFIPDC